LKSFYDIAENRIDGHQDTKAPRKTILNSDPDLVSWRLGGKIQDFNTIASTLAIQ
jgi:hypothetical protein